MDFMVQLVEMTIELDVTNLSREGLVTSSSMVISTKMIRFRSILLTICKSYTT